MKLGYRELPMWIHVVVLGAAGLLGQPEPGKAAAPLAGHMVEGVAARESIVERDFQGKVRRAEPTPIEAAVSKLKLEGEAKEKVERVFAERALVLDRFVEQNLDLLTRFGGAEQAGAR